MTDVVEKIKQKDFGILDVSKSIRVNRRVVYLNDVLKILSDETMFLSEKGLLEYLASVEHEQWAHLTAYFLENYGKIDIDTRNRWRELITTPYSKLSEKLKESDREWARKVLAILKVQLLFEKLRWEEKDKQKLLAKLLKLTKPRAGSIYSIQQEEGMMLLLTELLVGVKPQSRDHVQGLLHNLKYGFTAKGPRSKTIKKLMELKEKKFVEAFQS